MVGMERNQDVVKLASYAPLLENVNYYSWYPNLVIFNNLQSYVIPTYYAWKSSAGARRPCGVFRGRNGRPLPSAEGYAVADRHLRYAL